VVSIFLYLLQFPSYDVIMSNADCTAGREPRSIATSYLHNLKPAPQISKVH